MKTQYKLPKVLCFPSKIAKGKKKTPCFVNRDRPRSPARQSLIIAQCFAGRGSCFFGFLVVQPVSHLQDKPGRRFSPFRLHQHCKSRRCAASVAPWPMATCTRLGRHAPPSRVRPPLLQSRVCAAAVLHGSPKAKRTSSRGATHAPFRSFALAAALRAPSKRPAVACSPAHRLAQRF
jgi:hypothetical protein